jgi:hypothetical protein
MSPIMIGGLAGFVVGLVSTAVRRLVSARLGAPDCLDGRCQGNTCLSPAKSEPVKASLNTGELLAVAAWVDLIIFPLVGMFIGSRV